MHSHPAHVFNASIFFWKLLIMLVKLNLETKSSNMEITNFGQQQNMEISKGQCMHASSLASRKLLHDFTLPLFLRHLYDLLHPLLECAINVVNKLQEKLR